METMTSTTIQAIKFIIETDIAFHQKEVDTCKQKLNEDFIYWFAWKGETLWSNEYMLKELTSVYDKIKDSQDTDEVLKRINSRIESYEEFLENSSNVREDSSGSLHREVSTWKYTCKLQLKRKLNNYKKQMAK